MKKFISAELQQRLPNKDTHKTALGTTASVDWEYVEDTLELVEKLKV